MANLIGMPRAVWKRQPDRLMEVDYSFFNTPNVYVLCPGIQLTNSKNNIRLSLYGNSRIGVDFGRRSLITPGVNDYALTDANFPLIGTGLSKSVLINVVNHDLSGLFHYIFSSYTSIFVRHTSASNCWGFYEGTTVPSGEVLQENKEYNLLISVDGSTASFFSNGKKLSATGTASNFIGAAPLYINNFSNGTLGVAASTALIVVCDRDLDAVGETITENPWQIFKPRIARFILIPSAGPVTFKPYWARSRSLIIGSGV